MSGHYFPAALPAHVVSRADVQEALSSHDFGRVFRLARKWGGISFVKIADACDIKPERVGKLARGEGSITTYEKIAQIADALRIPGHLIGLAARPWEVGTASEQVVVPEVDQRLAGVSLSGELLAADELGAADLEGDDVQRRTFLAGSMGLTGGAVVASEMSTGRRIGQQQVRFIQRRTVRLRALDDVLGGADTQNIYRCELSRTLHLLKRSSYSHEIGQQLLNVAAEQAQQAGWAAFDAGHQAEASALYAKAHRIATEAGDLSLAGNALAFLAYQQVSADASGVATAVASCETAGSDAPSTVRALLYERRAWAHAKAGQAQETEIALNLAEEALAQCQDDVPEPHWSSWVDARELQIMKGRCWTELHRPLRAVPALEGALQEFDETHARDKALYLTWLAHAYLDAGEVEQSTKVIGAAMDLSSGVGSVRPQQRAREFVRRLQPHQSMASVVELIDRVAV